MKSSVMVAWFGLLLFRLLACHSGLPSRPGKVGLVERDWSDTTRRRWDGTGDRPLSTTIWYPAQKTATERAIAVGLPGVPFFHTGFAAPEAPLPSATLKRPLVLLSHGTGGTGQDLAWLAEWLVARGYLAAAVTHHGNSVAPGEGARQIGIPLRVVVGTHDELAPPGANAEHLARHVPGAELLSLPEVGHYTFLSRCGWAGRLFLGELCRERSGVERAAVHAEVAADAYAFFERTLR